MSLRSIILPGLLGLSLVAFGWFQTNQLDAARATIEDKEAQIELLHVRIASDRLLIEGRDQLIDKQNQAVEALVTASEENRKAYQLRLAQAEARASTYRTRADDIMQLNLETTDTLERCEAAMGLILDEVGLEIPE